MAGRLDPNIQAHLEWLGFVQPTGLVFSAPALARAGVILPRADPQAQLLLRECTELRPLEPSAEPEPVIGDFERFAGSVLGWSFHPRYYAGGPERLVPSELELALPDYEQTIRPDYAVSEREADDGSPPWQLLVRVLQPGAPLDGDAHSLLERLLRHTDTPAGLLCNGRTLRLISAPRGESSGWLDFRVADMLQTAGRPIASALRLLLGQARLLTLPRAQRLTALLKASRDFQNEVSERLAEQVLHALYELLRGLQAAHDASGGRLLARALSEDPDAVYRALLTVVLRLVFLLYAEEREMLPADQTFVRHYSLAALYERLRADQARHPDTMGQRYGAWAQLLALFRMLHDGAAAPQLRMPARRGALFDPDRFPFLEGRVGNRQIHERIEPPLIPDGTVFRALDKLLVLDGERISYRALDVEQIGSVYETMMGFSLTIATGRSLAIRSQSRHGAPTTVSLDELCAIEPARRARWLEEQTNRKLTPKVSAAIRDAATVGDLHAALAPLADSEATPDLVPAGAMILQPTEERRKSGSHYTPRSLTEPIVRTALAPVLERLRGQDGLPPAPERLLELKVCDPAMGSGAFLVEVCRQLADQLIDGWGVHGGRPQLPADEDEVTFARRLIAQRCLYGVDRNEAAVDLAKMSLWLATLARDHPFTFLDHALRCGDSLVGLTRRQIESFHWRAGQPGFEAIRIQDRLDRVSALRQQIRDAGDDVDDRQLGYLWDEARHELSQVVFMGDLAVACFFSAAKPRDREARRDAVADAIRDGRAADHAGWLEELRASQPPLVPFHWEVELPEVFERERPGFDVIVGNPPFAGGRNLTAAAGKTYSDWLLAAHQGASGGADLVAHFFRRAFDLIRRDGAFGLIATNTIAQGDTRASGLRWICTHGGEIYSARKRLKWPGRAAVIVSVVHVFKGPYDGRRLLDGRPAQRISAYLFHQGGDQDPVRLAANAGRSFQGSIVLGMGFTFDDTDAKGVATPISEMRRLIEQDPANAEVIFPYIGGEEVNTSPTHAHHRYAINFGERSEEQCRARWPQLMAIVEEKVRPERITKDAAKYPRMVHEWWKFWNARPELHAAIADLDRVLVINCGATPHVAFAFQPADRVFANSLAVFPFDTHAAFCALQSRPHEVWARFFGSSLEDSLRYTPSDCFATFPFPEGWVTDPELEAAGEAYYEHRAKLMITNGEGLTKTYNRFHDPYEQDPGIERLRQLHAAMDRAVLRAYGFSDIPADCEFLLDYEIDEAEWGRKRKPYRYRWPDELRDEVLARLIALNGERAAQEQRSGAAASGRGRAGRRRAPLAAQAGELF